MTFAAHTASDEGRIDRTLRRGTVSRMTRTTGPIILKRRKKRLRNFGAAASTASQRRLVVRAV